MKRTRELVLKEKQKTVDELVEQIQGSDALFFTEYRGLSVSQLDELRGGIRESKGTYRIIKNSLIMRAFDQLNLTCPAEMTKGPTGLVISTEDCPVIASKLFKFVKANEVAVVKGGILEGAYISHDDVKALSKLPSREVLIGQFVGSLQSIIGRFVMGLSSPVRGLVYSLDAIKNQKNN